jgi:uncharacterized membrane protein (UPF0127 family)
MKKFLYLGILASLAFLYGCLNLPENPSEIKLKLNNKDYLLEEAKNQAQREKGLMYRKVIPENKGMIFYFEKPEYLSFWMKNTYIPLQIVFINGCKIVDMQEMAVEANSLKPASVYKSNELADKAIELNSKSLDHSLIGTELKELCK